LLVNVHDELVFSIKPEYWSDNRYEIKAAMEGQPDWDIPFKVECETGPNWADLAPC
jgi:DNA polymerase I-like protein with 3'-5' exonuclease and polymerase domains